MFQRYVGSRCQRFPSKSPNYSSVYPLGWISMSRFIQVKNLLFLRTILVMPEEAICKQILVLRATDYQHDRVVSARNVHDSPTFKIFNANKEFEI